MLVSSLQRCLAADVFLRPLADKFTRLALQLVARYAWWLSSGAGDSEPGAADNDKVKELTCCCVEAVVLKHNTAADCAALSRGTAD